MDADERLRQKYRPLESLDTLAGAFIRGICAYAMRTLASCTGPFDIHHHCALTIPPNNNVRVI